MHRQVQTFVAAFLGLGAGCSGVPGPAPFPRYASVTVARDCPPAGPLATSLVFRPGPDSFDAAGPQLRLTVWRGPDALAGRRFSSEDSPPSGSGTECDGTSGCAPLDRWGVRFEEWGPDSTISGRLQTGVAPGTLREGDFRARWHSRTVFCM